MNTTDPVTLIRSLSREDLEAFVLECLDDDSTTAFSNRLIARFMPLDDGVQDRVHELIENHMNYRYDLLSNSELLSAELDTLKERNIVLEGTESQEHAFSVLEAIINELAPLCWKGDDHDGVLVDMITATLEDILKLARRSDPDPECLHAMRAWADFKTKAAWVADNFSWYLTLLRIHLAASQGEEEREEALENLYALCLPAAGSLNDFGKKYQSQASAEILLAELASPADAHRRSVFIEEHLHIDVVRIAAIDEALATTRYERVIELAREGMNIDEPERYSAKADRFARRIVEALDLNGEGQKAHEFIESRIFKSESIEWLNLLKIRIPEGEAWETVRERIIAKLPAASSHFLSAILSSENLIHRLLERVRQKPVLLDKCYEEIGRIAPEEAARHVEGCIRTALMQVSSRSRYRYIAQRIPEYARYAGKDAARHLIRSLCD